MSPITKKIFFCFSLTAALFLTAVNVGGTFLHEQLHHHASQPEQSDCAFYQLSAQVLLFAVVAAFAVPVFRSRDTVVTRAVYPFSIWRAFASPRAPPLARP